MEAIKPITKQIGRVTSEVRKILAVALLFIFSPLALAQASIAVDFIFPVLTGMPRREQISIPIKAPVSLKNESHKELEFAISPIDFIILFPPKSVESIIIPPTNIAKATTLEKESLAPLPSKNNKMPINFCPSCAPCIKEIEAQENIRSLLYGKRLFFNARYKKEVIA